MRKMQLLVWFVALLAFASEASATFMDRLDLRDNAYTFATLPAPVSPFQPIVYCSDCTQTDPCAGSGTGAVAMRIAGTWQCGAGTEGSGGGSPGGSSGDIQTNDGAGGFGAYAGDGCTVGECVTDIGADGTVTCGACSAASSSVRMFSGSVNTFNTSTAEFMAVNGISVQTSGSAGNQLRPIGTVTFSDLTCALTTAVPGSGKSWTIALTVGGSASALSVTIADTAAVSSTDTDEVVVTGDGTASTRIYYTVTPSGTPDASRIACTITAAFS